MQHLYQVSRCTTLCHHLDDIDLAITISPLAAEDDETTSITIEYLDKSATHPSQEELNSDPTKPSSLQDYKSISSQCSASQLTNQKVPQNMIHLKYRRDLCYVCLCYVCLHIFANSYSKVCIISVAVLLLREIKQHRLRVVLPVLCVS